MPPRRSKATSQTTKVSVTQAESQANLTTQEEALLTELLGKKSNRNQETIVPVASGPRRSLRTRNTAAAPEATSTILEQGQVLPIRKDLKTVVNASKKRPPSSPRASNKLKAAKVTNNAAGSDPVLSTATTNAKIQPAPKRKNKQTLGPQPESNVVTARARAQCLSSDEPASTDSEAPFIAPVMDIDMSDISEQDKELMNRCDDSESDVESVTGSAIAVSLTNQVAMSKDHDSDEDVGNETIRPSTSTLGGERDSDTDVDDVTSELKELTASQSSLSCVPPRVALRALRRTYAIRNIAAVAAAVAAPNADPTLSDSGNGTVAKPCTDTKEERKRIIEAAMWDSDVSEVEAAESDQKPVYTMEKYPNYMILTDLSSNPPGVLKQTPQVRMIIRLAIEASTTVLIFVNAHLSGTERLKNYRQILVNVAKVNSYTEMVQAIENDFGYYKVLSSIVTKRMNNVRQDFKNMALGLIEATYNVNEWKQISFSNLFGIKVYVFPLKNETIPGVFDQTKPYLNPSFVKFVGMFFTKNSDYLEKHEAKFPVCNGQTEMHPELLAFIAMMVHTVLLEKFRETAISLASKEAMNAYRSHVNTLAMLKKADKLVYHEMMTLLWRRAINGDNDDNKSAAESDRILEFMGISGKK